MAPCTEKIRFACPHCGSRLSVSADKAGRRGKCPRCKEPLTVPAPNATPKPVDLAQPISTAVAAENASAASGSADSDELTLVSPVLNESLLDLSRTQAREGQTSEDPEAYDELRYMQGRHRLGEAEEPPERKRPWIVDIFLYPLNTAGLIALGIAVGGPLLLQLLAQLSLVGTLIFPPIAVFWAMFYVLHWVALVVLCAYLNWYACECIRDSAVGGIRAADTIGITPGLGNILLEIFRVSLSALVCAAPAVIYATQTRQTGGVFFALLGVAAFFLPMALMAVVRFESIHVLNPILLIGSILSTLLPYCLLVPVCYTLLGLLWLAASFLVSKRVTGYFLLLAAYYTWLILAHLLGRFCWKYEKQLNWDV